MSAVFRLVLFIVIMMFMIFYLYEQNWDAATFWAILFFGGIITTRKK